MTNYSNFGVVFDVNVYLDALFTRNKQFPELAKVPPSSGNAALDCLSLAFDGEDFKLHISPHIIENIARVMHEDQYPGELIGKALEALVEIVDLTGGSVVDPPRLAHDSKDFEDNLILDLVKYTDSRVLVTSDNGLLAMNPWNYRLIMRPMEFLDHIL